MTRDWYLFRQMMRWASTCYGKEPHRCRSDAQVRIKRGQRFRPSPMPLHAYRCEFCQAWHIGHRSSLRRKSA